MGLFLAGLFRGARRFGLGYGGVELALVYGGGSHCGSVTRWEIV